MRTPAYHDTLRVGINEGLAEVCRWEVQGGYATSAAPRRIGLVHHAHMLSVPRTPERPNYNHSLHNASDPATRLGPYVIEAPIGAGCMSACGHGERAKRVELRRVRAFSRRGRTRGAARAGGGALTRVREAGPARTKRSRP